MPEWLLIVLIFSGPTSPNHITVERFKTEAECRKAEDGRLGRVCLPVAVLAEGRNGK